LVSFTVLKQHVVSTVTCLN